MIIIKNKQQIELKFIIILLFIHFFLIATYIMCYFSLMGALVLGLILLLLLPIVYVIEKNFMFFEYEYSGEVVSIRRSNFLLKRKVRITEFPKEKLIGFQIEKILYTTILKIEIQSNSKVKVINYFTIIGLSEKNTLLLENSLQWILIEKNCN